MRLNQRRSIPLPNWCHNRLVIESDDESFIEDLVAAFRTGNLLSFISPSPQALVEAAFDPDSADKTSLRKEFGFTTLDD